MISTDEAQSTCELYTKIQTAELYFRGEDTSTETNKRTAKLMLKRDHEYHSCLQSENVLSLHGHPNFSSRFLGCLPPNFDERDVK